jgi:histidine triad (HIT) family protein
VNTRTSRACVFCAITAGRAPASLAFEDEVVYVAMDIAPVNPGHLLVVPRAHSSSLSELDEGVGAHLFVVAMRMAEALRRTEVRCEGINLFLADGEAAFQDVFHVHLHVLPRFRGDSFRIDAEWSARPDRKELDRLATLVRAAAQAMS